MQEVEQRREQLPRQETESGRRRSEVEILRFTESRSTERACHGRGGRSERSGGPFARRAGSPWMANSGLSSAAGLWSEERQAPEFLADVDGRV